MNKAKSGISSRTIVAVVLVAASFLSSFVLSRAANRTELLWSAHGVLLPGALIRSGDIELRRAAIPEGAQTYVRQDELIVGFQVLRPIGAGEFIPTSAVNRDQRGRINIEVPISVQSSDLPAGLTAGQKVNIYHVNESQGAEKIGKPSLILGSVYVMNIDQKSQSMSGATSLTLSIAKTEVIELLAATSSGRVVVVLLHG
jgi:hypothetical protein